jgi:hypothetical protein
VFAAPDLESVLQQPEAELGEVPWIIQPNPDVTISGDLEYATAGLWREAQEMAVRHRKYVQGFAKHPFARISAIRKAQPHSWAQQVPPGEASFDYVAEACRTLEPKLPRLQRFAGRLDYLNDAITPELNRVQRKVAGRRSRAGMPSTPPKNWRRTVTAWVMDQLRQ